MKAGHGVLLAVDDDTGDERSELIEFVAGGAGGRPRTQRRTVSRLWHRARARTAGGRDLAA